MGWLDKLLGRKPREEKAEDPPVRIECAPTLQPDPEGGLVLAFDRVEGSQRTPVVLPLMAARETAAIAPEAWAAEAALSQLLDSERAEEISPGRYLIPYAQLDRCDGTELSLLGMDRAQGWRLNLDVNGTIGRGGVKLTPKWTAPNGNYDVVGRGNYIEVPCGLLQPETNTLHILPRPLTRALRDARELSSKRRSMTEEFVLLAQITDAIRAYEKELEEDGLEAPVDIELDGQLEKERFIAPDRVRLDLRPNHETGGLELRPLIEGYDTFEEAEQLLEADTERFALYRKDPKTGQTIRVALPERTRKEVDRIRKKSQVPREDVKRFVEDPRRYLQPPEELDEEELSGGELPEEDDTLDLSLVAVRAVEYNLEDYGSRVVAISADAEEVDIEREKVFGLGKGWFGPEVEVEEEAEPSENEEEELEGFELPSGKERLQTADNIDEIGYEEERARLLRERFEDLSLAACFEAKLYNYQEEGYAWLRSLHDTSAERIGGLLADDMGLGKTVQVIALLSHMHEEQRLGPSLLVVPKTVIPNWQNEIGKFCSANLFIVEHLGAGRASDHRALQHADIILTTYDTMVRDQLMLGKLELHILALDEAQYIKNYTTKRASAARAMNARVKLALTATPVENNLDELWSIMDFAQPGLLGTLTDFRDDFAVPLEIAAARGDGSEDAVARSLLMRVEEHYLRRTKAGVLSDELPSKYIHIEEVRMTDFQRRMYDSVRKHYIRRGSGALPAIRAMLDVCAHPLATSEKVLSALDEVNDLREICANDALLVDASNKFTWLTEKLEEVKARNEKAILFSSFRRVQAMLKALVRSNFGVSPAIINGDVSAGRRQDIVSRFNTRAGFDVIILSAQAAGVGINVTGANHVFHMTREWNPAKENQATDRAYRIGQERDVHVYLPVTVYDDFETIDVRLHQLLESKQRLATNVIRPSKDLQVDWKEMEDCFRGGS